MSTISKDTYRSAGKGVNCTDDMVRVTINLTRKEFNRIEHRLEAALKSSESRPTVKGSSPAQNTMEICHTAPNNARDETVRDCTTCEFSCTDQFIILCKSHGFNKWVSRTASPVA